MQLTSARGALRVLLMTMAPWVSACDPAPASRVERPTAVEASSPTIAGEVRSSIGFRSNRLFDEHFAKHGREFGNIPQGEYLRRAQALRDAPAGDGILEAVRTDGVVSRFDRGSGGFIAFDRNGTIRTFFRPNDGEAYFHRQANRRPQGP